MLPLLVLGPTITFASLLDQMGDRSAVAKWPLVEYQSLQASSYNRESVKRGEPGWFADSDGTGYIRQDENDEYVLMEHEGPGCITKMWTPFFYYDFNERKGPNVRIYLDGAKTPVIDESLIDLVSGKGTIKPPFAAFSARAGNSYLPIPFGKSCRVTMKEKPFYNIIAYRAYPKGTGVETFRTQLLTSEAREMTRTAKALAEKPPITLAKNILVEPNSSIILPLEKGPGVVTSVSIGFGKFYTPDALRSVVFSARFDGEETVWAPVGDFFSNPDGLHPYSTWTRTAREQFYGSTFQMPYRKDAELALTNLGPIAREVRIAYTRSTWKWDNRSMHFYARWRPDDIVPGTPFSDWNFIDIRGKGVYVGDAWTVLNKRKDSWWGEGDEKVYVDDAWEKGFPTHFGTGTEDYYGWAGGVYPDLKDEFSQPFLANVKVGGLDGHTMGYNICTRVRNLDAIPFKKRLRFDMESSFGTDMRTTEDRLGYSAMTFFYAFPGAVHNRPADTKAAKNAIMNLQDLERSPGSREHQK